MAVCGVEETHTLQLVPLEERGDCKPGSWKGKQGLGATCNIYHWYSSRMGASSEAEAGNRSRGEKNSEKNKAKLAKKPTMPRVCLDEIERERPTCEQTHSATVSLHRQEASVSAQPFGQSKGPATSRGNPSAINRRVYMKLTAEGESRLADLTRLEWWSTRRSALDYMRESHLSKLYVQIGHKVI